MRTWTRLSAVLIAALITGCSGSEGSGTSGRSPSASVSADFGSFCDEFTRLDVERPESYIGSAEQVTDIEGLAVVAPDPVRDDVDTFLDYLASGAIDSEADPESNLIEAEQLAGRWYLVTVDGVDFDAAEGDYWTFTGTNTALEVGGFDGCNAFGTFGDLSAASASIVDGRLENVALASEEMACADVEYGPYPQTGALLTISDDGATLTPDAPSATVELSRTPATPAGNVDESPLSVPSRATCELSPPNPRAGETFTAKFDPTNSRGGYFTLEQQSGSEWLPATFLLETDANGGPASWTPTNDEIGMDDYGVEGAGTTPGPPRPNQRHDHCSSASSKPPRCCRSAVLRSTS